MLVIEFFASKKYLLLSLSGFFAYFVSKFFFPIIIYLSKTKNIMDVPCSRSMHKKGVPTLGGVGIFLAFILVIIVCGILIDLSKDDLVKMLSLIFSVVLLLFLGIKDDLIGLSPTKKIVGQMICSFLVVITTDIRLESFGGILGIGELPYFISVVFSVFFFVFIINAFNLTDGIDGLAASTAIIVSSVLGVLFILRQDYLMASISFILVGSLLSFLKFNLSYTQKIFMGDSGSMFIGFLLAFQSLGALEVGSSEILDFSFNSGHIIVLAILAFPILDTSRVFFIRLKQGKSPFSADKNHLHHKLLSIGMRHLTATLIVCGINIVVILAVLYIDTLRLNVNIQLLIVLTLVLIMYYYFPFLIGQLKDKIKMAISRFNLVQ